MRKNFVECITELMAADEDIVFLTGDLGFGSFEGLAKQFPARFYNVGIAEQNMVGVACGLGLQGKKVIIYSISNFCTLRVVEQIRNYLIYHSNHVLIVNGGAAFSYGQLGYTHHAVEDVPVMKSLPYIDVFAPFDRDSIYSCIKEWYHGCGVAYLRLEKNEIDLSKSGGFAHTAYGAIIGDLDTENYIVTYGTIAEEAINARLSLANSGIKITVAILTNLKKIPIELFKIINGAQKVIFLEECAGVGGVGEHYYAQCMINSIKIANPVIFGVKDWISGTIGDQKYLRALHGIDSKNIESFFEGDVNA